MSDPQLDLTAAGTVACNIPSSGRTSRKSERDAGRQAWREDRCRGDSVPVLCDPGKESLRRWASCWEEEAGGCRVSERAAGSVDRIRSQTTQVTSLTQARLELIASAQD